MAKEGTHSFAIFSIDKLSKKLTKEARLAE